VISMNALRIIRAREESPARINDLIARSKSYWGWPAEYLEKARPHALDALTVLYSSPASVVIS